MSETLPITILGSSGWIGSSLANYLREHEHRVTCVDRLSLAQWLADCSPQGLVVYAIGLTSDFRKKPFDTCKAHVDLLSEVIQRPGISKLLYLSSTRVYSRSLETVETAPLPCLSSDPSDIYNLSKLLGEALVLQDSRPDFKVVRLSNVIGVGQPITTFVGSLIDEAKNKKYATILQSPKASKDYIALNDVMRFLPLIANNGRFRIYNLGSGFNVSNQQIADWLRLQGLRVRFKSISDDSPSFGRLNIERLAHEFAIPGDPLIPNLFQ